MFKCSRILLVPQPPLPPPPRPLLRALMYCLLFFFFPLFSRDQEGKGGCGVDAGLGRCEKGPIGRGVRVAVDPVSKAAHAVVIYIARHVVFLGDATAFAGAARFVKSHDWVLFVQAGSRTGNLCTSAYPTLG